jgi:3-deoxy-D-manno-octulosonate 8-phosphate phosphatase (KDO 8-P phosphatase)
MATPLDDRLANIKLIGFDIDGVFTDGRFYLSDTGVETKAFHTQDGYGVRALIRHGIEVAVVSGRRSGAVERRMQELGVSNVILGSKDKVADFTKLARALGVSMEETAFVGDDLPDLPLLNLVGLPIAVANAVQELKERCAIVTAESGGFGAVREIADRLLAARREGAP